MANTMKNIRIEKVTLNIGAGKSPEKLEKGIKLMAQISGKKPIKTITNKRIPTWGLRPKLPIGCKVTLRKKYAVEMLKRLVDGVDKQLKKSQFDNEGNVSFGIREYINVPGAKYDPEIGIMGFQTCITLERSGFRIKKRKLCKKRLPKQHKISQAEAMEFMEKNYGVKIN
ncbi:MAG: 50S ribosomal protein L5 [Candidatus Woesearchaeota archaeon]|nr:50S ribosomal protein L5 [Candidatus Woesearchaeota archaeon]